MESPDNNVYNRHFAALWKGGWWYKDYYYANLNGLYLA